MISVNNISISFLGKDVFKNFSFVINPKERIGLIGKNGAGKSTLLKIISDKQKPDSGNISKSEGFFIGYLPQEIRTDSKNSIYDEMLLVFEDLNKIENDIKHITTQLEIRIDYESKEYNKLIQELSEKHEKLALYDVSKVEKDVSKILKGLGFKESEFVKPMNEFSGGWQMRVELGKLLLKNTDLLLLDEPTNHLDIDSILWLENYLNQYAGSVIMISHDKAFLDNTTNRTIEIVFGKMYDYKVSYSKYFALRKERLETQIATTKNQQKSIEQQERFIERFKAKASKSKQVQSKQKQLDKIDRIELDELDTSKIKFKFPPAPHSGNVVLRVKDLSKSYGDKKIFENINLEIVKGEKIAFVGKNGMGKTTFIKLIADNLSYDGTLTLGHQISIGYYAQIQENTLNQNLNVLETIENAVKTDEWSNISKIRGLLGSFLFKEDDIHKQVKVLSGGEKSRLALAKLILEPCNLLILDEPTNHLDIASKEVLKNALQNYNGTLIVVSHDRDFLDGLIQKTYEFIDGNVKEYLGDIQYFLSKHKIETFREFELTAKENKKNKKQKVKSKKHNNNGQLKELKKELQQIENRINKVESDIKDVELSLHQENIDVINYKESKTQFYKHNELNEKLKNYMERWENVVKNIEYIESK